MKAVFLSVAFPLALLVSPLAAFAKLRGKKFRRLSTIGKKSADTGEASVCVRTIDDGIANVLYQTGAVGCETDSDCESGCCLQTYCFCRGTFTGDNPATYQCTPGPSTPNPTPPATDSGDSVCKRTIHDDIATVLYQIGALECAKDKDCESGCCLQVYCMCYGTFTGDNPDNYRCTDNFDPTSGQSRQCFEDADCGAQPPPTPSPTPETVAPTRFPIPRCETSEDCNYLPNGGSCSDVCNFLVDGSSYEDCSEELGYNVCTKKVVGVTYSYCSSGVCRLISGSWGECCLPECRQKGNRYRCRYPCLESCTREECVPQCGTWWP